MKNPKSIRALWGGLVVSTINNVLRPILVGRDTVMDETGEGSAAAVE